MAYISVIMIGRNIEKRGFQTFEGIYRKSLKIELEQRFSQLFDFRNIIATEELTSYSRKIWRNLHRGNLFQLLLELTL